MGTDGISPFDACVKTRTDDRSTVSCLFCAPVERVRIDTGLTRVRWGLQERFGQRPESKQVLKEN